MTVFVDSTIWFAAAVARDRDNARAKAILSGQRDFITSDHVLAETWTLLESGYGRDVAEQFWRGLRQARVRIETVTPVDLEMAAHNSAGSFVDRLNLAMMARVGVMEVATLVDLPAGTPNDIRVVHSGQSEAFRLLSEAVLSRRSIRCVVKGQHFELLPHVLGHTAGRERVHGYQLHGSSKGAPKGWRCFDVAELTDLSLGEEPWRELPRISQRCVERVYLDVDPNIPGQPGRR